MAGAILKRNGLIESRRRRPGAFEVKRGERTEATRPPHTPSPLPALILLAALSLSDVAQTAKGKGKPPRAPLPENVEIRAVTVFSDGTRMAGDLYLLKALKPNDKLPAVVLCARTAGTRGGRQAIPRSKSSQSMSSIPFFKVQVPNA